MHEIHSNFFQDRYLICSGGYDGKVHLYSAVRLELLMCCQITTMTLAKHVSAAADSHQMDLRWIKDLIRWTSNESQVS